MAESENEIVKITSAGTVTIPKQFRKHIDYVKISLKDDSLIVKKTTIT